MDVPQVPKRQHRLGRVEDNQPEEEEPQIECGNGERMRCADTPSEGLERTVCKW